MTTLQAAVNHVQESIATQQKPITVAALSSAAGISVRSAQQALEKFRSDQETQGVSLRSFYSVSGALKAAPEAGQAWKIVSKEDLESVVAKFENPHSEIYSLAPPDETNSKDVKGMMADLWAEDLVRVTAELNEASKQNGLWRPAHVPPCYCTPSASEKRELYIPGYSGGKPCPSPMKNVQPPGANKTGNNAASTFGRPAAKPANIPKAQAPVKKVEETPMPDVSKVKITDKTPVHLFRFLFDFLREMLPRRLFVAADPAERGVQESIVSGALPFCSTANANTSIMRKR